MSDRQRVPNVILRRIREQERQETRSEFAEAMARKAAELGEPVSPSERYVARLEDGEVIYPHPPYRRILTALCGRPITELGFVPHAIIRRGAPQAIGETLAASPHSPESNPILSEPSLDEIEFIRRSLHEMVGDNPMS